MTTLLLQADTLSPEQVAAFYAAYTGLILGGLALSLGILAAICWMLQASLERVPPVHRKCDTWWPWLLMIPCFSLVWNFIFLDRLAKSFKSYFDSVGRQDVGDAGAGIFLAYSIVAVFNFVPYLNCLAMPASIVLLIIVLVKAWDLSRKVEADIAWRASQPRPQT